MTALRGRIGRIDWKGISGWARDSASPRVPVELEILVDDRPAGRMRANSPRPGLKQLPEGQRNCGFQLRFPRGLSALTRHVVQVRRVSDQAEIEGSPAVLEPGSFGAALEDTFGAAVETAIANAAGADALDGPLRFVAQQLDTLLADRAKADDAALPPELARLRQRLHGLLTDPGADVAPFANDEGQGLRRVLVIADVSARLDSAARAVLGHVAALVRLGLRVECATAEDREATTAFGEALRSLGVPLFGPPYYVGVEDVLKRNRALFDIVYCHGLAAYERYAALARHYCPRARMIYGVGTLQSVSMDRRGALQRWPAATELAVGLRLRESFAALTAHCVVAYATAEADRLRQAVPQADIAAIPWPVEARAGGLPFDQRHGIAFLGEHREHADSDAAAILIGHIMPAIWQADPSMQCFLVWDRVPDQFRKMAGENFVVIEGAGEQERVLDRVRLTVAPHRFGALPNPAVLASLAAGVPCVASPVAMEGIAVPDALHACIGKDTREMAEILCRLHDDATAHATCAQAGIQTIAEGFSPAHVDGLMRQLVGPLPGATQPEAATQDTAVAAAP